MKETAAATHSLTCGVSDRESNKMKFSREATELIDEWQKQFQGVPPVNLQASEHEEVVLAEKQRACCSVNVDVNLNEKEDTSTWSCHVRGLLSEML